MFGIFKRQPKTADAHEQSVAVDPIRALIDEALLRAFEEIKPLHRPYQPLLDYYLTGIDEIIRREPPTKANRALFIECLTKRLIAFCGWVPSRARSRVPASSPIKTYAGYLEERYDSQEWRDTMRQMEFDVILPYIRGVQTPLRPRPGRDLEHLDFPDTTDINELLRQREIIQEHKKDLLSSPNPLYSLGQGYFKRLLFGIPIPLPFDDRQRFEHSWVIAKTGHGKTSLIQHLIAADLDAVVRGERSIIVIDTKGSRSDLIGNLSQLKIFAENPERLVFVDPTDIDYPIALSLFTMGLERVAHMSAADRERQRALVTRLLTWTINALLDAPLSAKQKTLFTFTFNAMITVIPNASLKTLREFLQPGGADQYAHYFTRLPPDNDQRIFFETQFSHPKQYTDTKQEITWRLDTVLTQSPALARMFSAPSSELDLFAEMNAGKCIIINADRSLLQPDGAQMYARFFIALISAAVNERLGTMRREDRLPCFVFMDEFGTYAASADEQITDLFKQAREANVGLMVGHTELADLAPKTAATLMTNTATKFAAKLSHDDAAHLAKDMRCTPEFIQEQLDWSFAIFISGKTDRAVSSNFFHPGCLASLPHMTPAEADTIRDIMRRRYSVGPSEAGPGPRHHQPQDAQSQPDDGVVIDGEYEVIRPRQRLGAPEDGTKPSTEW